MKVSVVALSLAFLASLSANANAGEKPVMQSMLEKTGFGCRACLTTLAYQAKLINGQGAEGRRLRNEVFNAFATLVRNGVILGPNVTAEQMEDVLYSQEIRTAIYQSYQKRAATGEQCVKNNFCSQEEALENAAKLQTDEKFSADALTDTDVASRAKRGVGHDVLNKIKKAYHIGKKISCKICRMAVFAFLRLMFAYTNFAVGMIDDWCGTVHFNIGKVGMQNCQMRYGEHKGSISVLIAKFYNFLPLGACKFVGICSKDETYSTGELISVMTTYLKTVVATYGGSDPTIAEDIIKFQENVLRIGSNAQLHEFLQPSYVPGEDDQDKVHDVPTDLLWQNILDFSSHEDEFINVADAQDQNSVTLTESA